MSTPPVTPQQEMNLLVSDIHESFSQLAHKQVTLSYGLIITLVLFMGLTGVGGYLAVKHFDQQEARAEAREAQYRSDLSKTEAQWTQDRQALQASNDRIAQLEAQIAHRASTPPPKAITDGLKPDATAEQAALALKTAYSAFPDFGEPVATPEGKVLTTVTETQILTSSKLLLDRTQADLKDRTEEVDLLKTNNSLLNNNFQQCQGLLTEANKNIADYKALAKKSKFRKFLDGAEKVGLVLLGGIVGHAI